MHKELEIFNNVGRAVCTVLSDNFATLECPDVMNAIELEDMLEMGWELAHVPVATKSYPQNPEFKHTFRKVK